MAAARVLSVRGVVYCHNSAPIEGRLSVELSGMDGRLLSGTMTEPDGSFLISADAGVMLRYLEIRITVWRGTVLVKQLSLSTREALSRSLWLPIEETASLLKVCGVLRDDMGFPAEGHRIRVVRIVARPDGKLVKMKIGRGETDAAGQFCIVCTTPRIEGAQPLIQIQAYTDSRRPAVCVTFQQDTDSLSPVSLILPCEEPTLILESPVARMMA
ncbi:MAG: hypothetical protein ACI8RZ_006443 [Myxococcota bacterium]|jgi:hypothetical protein